MVKQCEGCRCTEEFCDCTVMLINIREDRDALREQNKALEQGRDAANNKARQWESIHIGLQVKLRSVEAERDRYKKALEEIKSYDKKQNGTCPYGCDTPNIAQAALRSGEKV